MTVPENEIHYLEIVTPDAQGSRDFYSQAYGWNFEPMELPGQGTIAIYQFGGINQGIWQVT